MRYTCRQNGWLKETNAHKSSSHFGGLCCPCVHQFYNLENPDIADLDLDADIHQNSELSEKKSFVREGYEEK